MTFAQAKAFIARAPTTTATPSRVPSPTGRHETFRPPAVHVVSTSDPSESVTRARPLPLSTSDRRDHRGTRAVTSCAASSGCSMLGGLALGLVTCGLWVPRSLDTSSRAGRADAGAPGPR